MGCASSNTRGDSGSGGAGTGGDGSTAGSGGTGGFAAVGGAAGTGAISGTGGVGGVGGVGGMSGTGGTGGVGPSNTVSLCGGVECGSDERCCLLTFQCFNPTTNPDACRVPDNTPPGPNGTTSCVSNADCAANEMCTGLSQGCGGLGYCTTRDNCGSCSTGSLGGPCTVCGCDGVTYRGVEAACAAGVRVSSTGGGCGERQTLGGGGSGGSIVTITYCGADSQCPSGDRCCARTGECFDPTKPALCDPPVSGGFRGCYTDADCYYGVCIGEGCEGPGACDDGSSSGCSSVLSPVCGCDGQTYTNAGCAHAEGMRIASNGACM